MKPAQKRLLRDLQKLTEEDDQSINASPNQNNLYQWNAFIQGSDKTIWEGGIFELKMKFTQQYPVVPPQVFFVTKMFHPNIYQDGRICIDILKNQWSSVYDVWAILTSIRSLLADPNPNSPANNQAAQIYVKNRIEYQKRVKQCVQMSLI